MHLFIFQFVVDVVVVVVDDDDDGDDDNDEFSLTSFDVF